MLVMPEETYVVAYIDMLGTTRLIQSKERSAAACAELRGLYRRAIAMGSNCSSGEIVVKIFSDNLILAQKLNGKTDQMLIKNFLEIVSLLQYEAVCEHAWLLRGGITIGGLFLDDVIIWGQALLRSYELESHIAIYPRVVIDPNREVLATFSQYDIGRGSYFMIDSDGQLFLDYLYGRQHYRDLQKCMFNSFDLMLESAKGKNNTIPVRIFQKLCWHKHYVNEVFRTWGSNLPEYKLEIDAGISP